jgi:DNA replication licensing factor MCM3
MIKPGDEVSIVGVYRQIEKRTTGQIPILCKAVLVANNIEVRTHRQDSILTTLSEIQEIRRFVFATSGTRNNSMDKLKRFKMLNLLALSLAPSIYGLDVVKRSLILQLVGGVRKSLSSGTHLRGDINILLVGEPGVAKSQLLRAILHVSPLSISTTGRSSSEAGLTAVVTRDKETKERRVEAGAMVLADRGILLVDEFDKMTNQDRMSIHEALEQQTVTITKAGVHITLNARCSVLAAANPLFGMYDTSISLSRNINLPDSLMSRFDLMFVLVDKTSEKLDEKIARHVLAIRAESESISENHLDDNIKHQNNLCPESFNENDTDNEQCFSVWAKKLQYNLCEDRILRASYIRKLVSYIRCRPVEPKLITRVAQDMIIRLYVELRNKKTDLPITARTLETIIRLSTANAKLCLDFNTVNENDVAIAQVILCATVTGEYCDPGLKVVFSDKAIQKEKDLFSTLKSNNNSVFCELKNTTANKNHREIRSLIFQSDRDIMLQKLTIMCDYTEGMINLDEYCKSVWQSEKRFTMAQLRCFLQTLVDEGKLIQGNDKTFFVAL